MKPDRAYTRREVVRGMVLGGAAILSGATGLSFAGARDKPEEHPMRTFIDGMPKAELHVQLEGTVAPATAMDIAARNGITMPYRNAQEFEAALNFNSLASFLEGFHNTIAVLQTEEDFYEITHTYLARCHAQNVVYADLKFDPQAHLRRGIAFDVFFSGIRQAQLDAQREMGIASQLIMCFQRDASLETAEVAFAEALKRQDQIVGVGLDNTEVLNFPSKFADIFTRARDAGFMLTSHCDLGQPNSVEHIRACLEDLNVDRLDHGYNILEDDRLVQLALDRDLCFTACPTSSFNTVDHSERFYFSSVCRAVGEMLELGMKVTINTDDPGVMGNRHLNEVIEDAAGFLELGAADVVRLVRNAFEGLWVPQAQKREYLTALAAYEAAHA